MPKASQNHADASPETSYENMKNHFSEKDELLKRKHDVSNSHENPRRDSVGQPLGVRKGSGRLKHQKNSV